MFDRDLFTYNEEKHLGYYNGELVPSITQLLDILYPYGENVPQERLKNKATKGTELHELLESINFEFDNSLDFDTNLSVAINKAIHLKEKSGRQELIDYVSILSAYKLRPFDYEEMVFLLDENGDLICYGHYDTTFMATKDIFFGDKVLFVEGHLYMVDYKTTSAFDKRKVALQISAYATAYEQCSKNYITNIYGLWFHEKAKIIPLVRKSNEEIISSFKELRRLWHDRGQN